MKFQNRQVTWSTLELTGLLEAEDSHVHFTRAVKHLALHPYHLNNVQRGLNQILRSSLNSYDREIKGFVLAFRNPKLLSNLGKMLYDSPFIHIDIEVDFYLFCPTVGSFLKGIVKKKGFDHIVVLVHKIYTVSIPKPDDTEEWIGESVEIGQEVKCCVTQINNRSKPPFICATLRSDYSQGCRLSESIINNIDSVDSAIESMNSTIKVDVSANGVPEDGSVSETERKKHRKKHKKSRENYSSIVCKVDNESESNDNLGNDISRIVKSEKKPHHHSMQDTMLNTDDSLNNLEVDNSSKKHKKSKKTSKLLLNDDTILDEAAQSRKAVKRENSIPLDSITETETKKRKKHAKKSKEFDSENEEKLINTENITFRCIKSERVEHLDSVSETETKKRKKRAKKSRVLDSENEEKVTNNTENTISRTIKSEKEDQHMDKKHIISNADHSSSNLKDSVSKKHKKHKKTSMKISDSESEGHFVKIKIEKQDPIVERIINESQTSCNETQNVQNLSENSEMPEFIKREVSIEYDSFEKERKKSSKKHTVTSTDSQLKSIKIKTEDWT
ncbi:uncharacterized protein Polr1f [Temnothorax nylanderi]|uniref:uncharacterized protein Polr1f n=1 Tax=Temnothorax nylanderi TaxID=102681 RepID=UPI003A8C77A9